MEAHWSYEGQDEALVLFNWGARHWRLPFHEGQRVLEIGAAETDFHARISAMGLDYTGIDARPCDHGICADVLTWEPERADFDWVILLGTLEHIGLGFYGDPVDEDGDAKALERCASWLRPGGMLWADVPFNPTYSVRANRHFRIYDTPALASRLSQPSLVELGRMFAPNAPQKIPGWPYPEPTEPCTSSRPPGEPYSWHFVSRWWVKKP